MFCHILLLENSLELTRDLRPFSIAVALPARAERALKICFGNHFPALINESLSNVEVSKDSRNMLTEIRRLL